MSDKIATYADGSTTTVFEGGGSAHDGEIAVNRFALICAKQALEVYIRSNGKFQVTRNGAHLAVVNVIEPITGVRYARSMRGKQLALDHCNQIIALIEGEAEVVDVERV